MLKVVKTHIAQDKETEFTQFPARIVAYSNQIASVIPVINHLFSDGDEAELPQIDGVPVIFPSGGGGIMSFPIQVGDPVWIECSMSAIDEWLEQYRDNILPSARRRHNLTDAVCLPCIYPKDRQIGVDNDHVELKFTKPSETEGEPSENINSLKMLNDGSVELTTELNHNLKLNTDKSVILQSEDLSTKVHLLADKSIVIGSGDAGNKIELLADGTVEITTASTIKIQNGSEELVNLLSEVVGLLADVGLTTTNTSIGPMPLNSAPALQALQVRIDTLKG
jgi:hypothetical protein